ncbi:MAG: sigma-70 family RNA polymerase sigma factor [Muribaculum sp.]|nr:sigma-70 family RNA polymerase sigma factor [Muribaculum sp.]
MQTTKTILTDDELVRAYMDGDNNAFDTLLERYQSKVYAYILHIVKNRDVADDIFQETFVKIILTLRQGRYTDTGKFGAWLNRIAHNLIIDHYRQEKSENTVSTDTDDADMLNRKDLCDENVEDIMISAQIRDDVRRIVEALPEPQREVLMMRYYQDMSFKEIADATGVSINTALGRMRYAILNMRRLARENNIFLTA